MCFIYTAWIKLYQKINSISSGWEFNLQSKHVEVNYVITLMEGKSGRDCVKCEGEVRMLGLKIV